MSVVLVDPKTREPLGPIPGEVSRRPPSIASHWKIERDETGQPIRMVWMNCGECARCKP